MSSPAVDEQAKIMFARYYSSGLGRFLVVDPVETGTLEAPQSWNKYIYVNDNPMAFVDPRGTDPRNIYAMAGVTGSGSVGGSKVGAERGKEGAKRGADMITARLLKNPKELSAVMDKAALARLRHENPSSKRTNREHAGALYIVGGRVQSTMAVVGPACHPTECTSEPRDAVAYIPPGGIVTGFYHTHGASGDPGYESFSVDDIQFANRTTTYEFGASLGFYLATPSNKAYFYPAGMLSDYPTAREIAGASRYVGEVSNPWLE